jgi:hypothetical protein
MIKNAILLRKIQRHVGGKDDWYSPLVVFCVPLCAAVCEIIINIKEKWCIKMYYSLPAGDLGSINHTENSLHDRNRLERKSPEARAKNCF